MYGVLAEDESCTPDYDPPFNDEELVQMYRMMVRTRLFDHQAISLHRQGRIHIYGSSEGEEGLAVASTMALLPEDWLFPDYRVSGALFQRGVTMRELLAQLFGTAEDLSKGRQLPTHHASRKLNIASIASPVGNGIPHAVGLAWAVRIKKGREVILNFFGDGATSEEGFHAGMNIAGVHKLPIVFVCRNNQYAISVPLNLQTGSKTIAIKAAAYGFDGVRVDGSDVLAVHKVVNKAVKVARSGGGPTLIEGVTYRHGAHTTSDDDTRYRERKESEEWKKRDPIARFRRYLRARGIWDDFQEEALQKSIQEEIHSAVNEASAAPPPSLGSLFDDVYSERPWHLVDQHRDLEEHLRRKKRSGI